MASSGNDRPFKRAYVSEVHVAIDWPWEDGFHVLLGDAVNGFKDQTKIMIWREVEASLCERIIKRDPYSEFALEERDRASESGPMLDYPVAAFLLATDYSRLPRSGFARLVSELLEAARPRTLKPPKPACVGANGSVGTEPSNLRIDRQGLARWVRENRPSSPRPISNQESMRVENVTKPYSGQALVERIKRALRRAH